VLQSATHYVMLVQQPYNINRDNISGKHCCWNGLADLMYVTSNQIIRFLSPAIFGSRSQHIHTTLWYYHTFTSGARLL